MRLLTTGAAAALMIAAAACTPADTTRAPGRAEAQAVVASPDVHPFRIGALKAWSLKDGDIVLPAGSDDVPWKDAAAVEAALTAAGQPTDAISLSIQPLLVRDGTRLVLIDTGAGGEMGTQDKLAASLAAAKIDPAAITDVLISHAHGDHVGGLVNKDGTLAFPNAVIRMSAPEWAFAREGAEAAGAGALLAAITPKVQAFQPGAQISPSIQAVALAGHTPGHSGYAITSGDERLLYVGDALHSSVLSVGHPEWTNAWDTDAAAGIATRQGLLDRAANGDQRLYGVHFAWPGVGRVAKQGDAYSWVADR